MTKRSIQDDKAIRHGDVMVDVTSNIVTVTVVTGDDHDHLELTPDQALRLADALSGVISWGEDD